MMRAKLGAAAVAVLAGWAYGQPLNDSCSSATAIAGFGTFPFDNNLATTDGLPDALCNFASSSEIFNDVWYCWTATTGGPVRARTCGSTPLDTKIAVYQGCSPCPTGGGIITCSDDNCALQTEVSFLATAGQTYLIRVGSYAATGFGAGNLEIVSGIVTGPVTNPANGHIYYLLGGASWTASEAAAVAMGGHLVTMNDAAENEWVRANVLLFDGADRRGWIGFNDVAQEGTFVWTSGEPSVYTNWSGGEPNNTNGLEHYTEMFGNGFWNDNTNAPPSLTVFGIVEIAGTSCYPNCDGSSGSPLLTANDFTCFLTRFVNGDSYANCDGVGGLTANDFSCFLNAYVAGCS